MTTHDKFQLCLARAKSIVSAYRKEAHGDPQNSWVAVAGLAVSATATAYGAYSQNQAKKKAAQQASHGAGAHSGSATGMPAYQPLDFGHMEKGAVAADQTYYGLSDQDYRQRHPSMARAERIFEAQTLKDQSGNNQLMPQLQSEYMRAGLGNALGSFGDTGSTLAPGSAGEADVARNLGLDILGFQQTNRANRQQSLSFAEGLFPRRTFGLNGQQSAQIEEMNNQGQNNWNQANFALQTQQGQFAANLAAQQQAGQQQQTAALVSAGAQTASGLLGAYSGSQGGGGQSFGTFGQQGKTADPNTGLMNNGYYATPQAAGTAYQQGNVALQPGAGYTLKSYLY